MTNPQLLPDFQSQLDHNLELRQLIQSRLDGLSHAHEQSKHYFKLHMMRMGPKIRAANQFTIQANEKTLAKMREQLETCDNQIRLLEMCINAVKYMEKQRAEQDLVLDPLFDDRDSGTIIP